MRLAATWIALLAAGSLCGCSHASHSAASSDAGSDDEASIEDSGAEAAFESEEAAPASALASLAGIRVANFSPTAPPFDLCLAPVGTADWMGPMLASLGSPDESADAQGIVADDGGVAGLGFPGVSAYLDVPPAQYVARWVVAGASRCPTVAVVPDTTLPALSAGALETVAWFDSSEGGAADAGVSDAGTSWTVASFVDDLAVPPDSVVGPGHMAVRFINAAPTIPVVNFSSLDVTGCALRQMFSSVAYESTSEESETYAAGTPFVDANGYLFIPETLALPFAFLALEGSQDTLLASGFSSAGPGTVTTIVLLPAGSGPTSFQLLQCVDNAGTVGASGACTLLPPSIPQFPITECTL